MFNLKDSTLEKKGGVVVVGGGVSNYMLNKGNRKPCHMLL